MENQVPLLRIKSYLSGKDPIKRTPKGVKYRVFHVKRSISNGVSRTFNGRGTVFFFSDFGNKANITKVKYDFDPQTKKFSNSTQVTWLNIKDGRLVLSQNTDSQFRNISNNPYKIDLNIAGGDMRIKSTNAIYKHRDKFQKIIIQWAARNGITISKKQRAMDFNKLLFTLCYPEIIYFFDVMPANALSPKKISSVVSSQLRGIKGLNHGFDRLVGSHGKKIKNKIITGDVFSNLTIARLFKNLLTVDDLMRILDKTWVPYLIPYKSAYTTLRYFLKNYSRETIVNWMVTQEIDRHTLYDVARDYYKSHHDPHRQKITLPDTNDFDEIDTYVNRVNRTNTRSYYLKETSIDYSETNKKYTHLEFTVGDLVCRLPKDSKEMIDVSEKLHNCLSGYVNQHGKYTTILFVEQQEQIKYAISIGNDNTLSQFYGKYNKVPTAEDYYSICDVLKTLNISTSYFDSLFIEKSKPVNVVEVF